MLYYYYYYYYYFYYCYYDYYYYYYYHYYTVGINGDVCEMDHNDGPVMKKPKLAIRLSLHHTTSQFHHQLSCTECRLC